MSLAVLADHMASKGRGGDSMLIHMAPSEIRGLQALAVANGTTLTTNPDTGLPEALSLKKLLPAIIGAGISYFSGGTIDPKTAGMIVGGIETARTGDLGKGISAGLGAYGGANLGASFTGAGEGLIGEQAIASSVGREAVARNIMENQMTEEAARAAVMKDAVANAGTFEKLGAGFEAATGKGGMQALKAASPMGAPGLGYSAAMAGGPAILAEMSAKKNMPQTVTQPGMIRPYSYDPISQQYFGGTPYRAAEGGLMGMADGGYNPGQLDFTQKSEPVVRMASGGIAGYAIGGTIAADLEKAYAAGDYAKVQNLVSANQVSNADIQSVWKGLDTSGLSKLGVNLYDPAAETLFQQTGSWDAAAKARDDAANASNAAMWAKQAADRDAANIAASTSGGLKFATGQGQTADQYYNTIGNQFNELTGYGDKYANATDAEIDAAAKEAETKYGVSYTDFLKGIGKSGGSLATQFAVGAGNMGLSGLNTNINAWIAKANADPRFRNLTAEQKRAEAVAAMGTVNMNEADVLRATGKTIAELFPKTLTCPPGYHKSADGLSCEKDKVVAGNFEDVPVTLFPGAGGGGNTVVNANGTITTGPNIPGIPVGGFTGMKQVRDAYELGGGSLGYTSPTFASLKAVEDKYPLRGGSKQSYDFLTGKTDYDPVPYTKTGEIARPYAEAVLGMPANISKKMYLFDPATKTYKVNPDYAIPTRDSKGRVTTSLTNKDVADYVGKAPSYDALYTWMTANNLSPEQVALASGKPFTEINKQFLKAQGVTNTEGKIDQTKVDEKAAADEKEYFDEAAYLAAYPDVKAELDTGKSASGKSVLFTSAYDHYLKYGKPAGTHSPKFKPGYTPPTAKASGGLMAMARGGMAQQYDLGGYSDGGRLLRGPGDGVSDSIPATIGNKRPARLADGEFVVPARIVSELGNGSTEAGARKLYAMMDRVQKARRGTVGKGRVAKNSRSEKYLPA